MSVNARTYVGFGVWVRPSDRLDLTAPVAPALDVVPPAGTTAGLLDRELGIDNLDGTPTFAQLQRRFAACLGSPLPAACIAVDGSGNPDFAVRTPRARREARETILAFMAGAQQAQVAGIPLRNAGGDILYHARSWALAESTLGVPAVVPPPLQSMPITHTAEYLLYRDGVRDFWLAGSCAELEGRPGPGVRELATRLAGSEDVLGGHRRGGTRTPLAGVNFIAAHDGSHPQD